MISSVPINDLKRVYTTYAERFNCVARDVLESGWWLNGVRNKAFCEEFARYIGVEHCAGVGNGSDALEIAMRAILMPNRSRGEEVITVANAGGYTTAACHQIGVTPVYVDIDRDSQLVDVSSLLSALSDRTRLVVVTHLYGGFVDVAALRSEMEVAGFGDVPILEDCAQAHGLQYEGRKAGSLGDIATFSFYPTKNLGALGDGGAIATNDGELIERVRQLQQYGWSSKYEVCLTGGRNSRLDEIQAAFLSEILPDLDEANAHRRAILDRYGQSAPEGVTIVRSPLSTVAHLTVALCPDRDRLRSHLTEAGIGTDIHYPVLDRDQPGWRNERSRIAAGGLVVSQESVSQLLTLPCFPAMTNDEIDRTCEALDSWKL